MNYLAALVATRVAHVVRPFSTRRATEIVAAPNARLPGLEVRYWRDKAGHEVDFVLVRRGRAPLALECKWRASSFDAS